MTRKGVCTIQDITGEGKAQVIHYQPFFTTNRYRGLKCSIPVNKLDQTPIRPLVSKTEFSKMWKSRELPAEEMTINHIKNCLKENNFEEMSQATFQLWVEYHLPEKKFAASKKLLLDRLLFRLGQEWAYINDKPLEEAQTALKEFLKPLLVQD